MGIQLQGLDVPQSTNVHDAVHHEVSNSFAAMILVHGHFVQFHHTFPPGCQGKGGNGLLAQKPEMDLSARIQNLTFWV